jgi:hypothetical protein
VHALRLPIVLGAFTAALGVRLSAGTLLAASPEPPRTPSAAYRTFGVDQLTDEDRLQRLLKAIEETPGVSRVAGTLRRDEGDAAVRVYGKPDMRRLHESASDFGVRLGPLMTYEPPAPGSLAPDFTLPRLEGSGSFRLSAFRGKRPVVAVFGSYT